MPRITYNSVNIDILFDKESLSTNHLQVKSHNRSGSGKIATINQHGVQEIEFAAILTKSVYRQLFAWWSWARQGQIWAFAFDTARTGNTTLDGAAASGQKVIPVAATAGFSVGDHCLIRAEDNDDEFEVVTIGSISAGVSITAEDDLIYSYTSSDIFRHWDYWPEVMSSEDVFLPEPYGAHYKHLFKFREKL